jgi:hypothetical protein
LDVVQAARFLRRNNGKAVFAQQADVLKAIHEVCTPTLDQPMLDATLSRLPHQGHDPVNWRMTRGSQSSSR